jgi:hypothetical protein
MKILRIFGAWRNEIACVWSKTHNEMLNDLYSSPKSFRLIEWRRIDWERQVAYMGDRRVV